MISIHHSINVKGHHSQLANQEVLNDLYSLERTAASLAKFTISPVIIKHSPGCEKFDYKIISKLYFSVRISYLLPTCHEKLMEELTAKSIL